MAYLYAVNIKLGSHHPEWAQIYENLVELNAKTLDYTSHWGICAIKSHAAAGSVLRRLVEGVTDVTSIEVEEITRNSIMKEHISYKEIYRNFFKRYDYFPNIG